MPRNILLKCSTSSNKECSFFRFGSGAATSTLTIESPAIPISHAKLKMAAEFLRARANDDAMACWYDEKVRII
jgi:hypothetical protein